LEIKNFDIMVLVESIKIECKDNASRRIEIEKGIKKMGNDDFKKAVKEIAS